MTGSIVGVVVLLALSFLFSMVEYGYVTITPMMLKRSDAREGIAERLRKRMAANHSMLIGVIVLGNNMANLGASFLFARIVLAAFAAVDVTLLSVVSTLVLTIVVVIFAETTPKNVGKAFPDQTTRYTAVLLYPLYVLLYPGAWVLSAISGFLTKPLLKNAKHAGYLNDSDDFRYLLKIGQEDGVIDKEEERLIYNIFDYSNTLSYEIMTPFVDVATVQRTASIAEVIRLVSDTGHSRLPVMEDGNVVGMLYAKDTLKALGEASHASLTAGDVMRQAFFAPETKKISSLLQEMQTERIQTAVLFDEYGKVSGLITVEDVLEEVFGEIRDEFDKEAPEIEEVGRDVFLMKGTVSTEKASELFGTELSGEDYDTVAGLVLSHIGRLPRVGDRIQHAGVRFAVVSVVGKRISRLRVERQPAAARLGGDEE
jgi:putative hemolysin